MLKLDTQYFITGSANEFGNPVEEYYGTIRRRRSHDTELVEGYDVLVTKSDWHGTVNEWRFNEPFFLVRFPTLAAARDFLTYRRNNHDASVPYMDVIRFEI